MNTKVVDINEIDMIIDVLENKGIVAIPTDTVYGFASIIDDVGIDKLFEVKNRQNNPIAVLVANVEQAKDLATIDEKSEQIMQKYMPGALTLIFNKKEHVSDLLTNNLDTVGIRIPDHKDTLKILEKIGPLAVTSANISGKEPHTSYETIYEDFNGKVDIILKGKVKTQVASTVIDTTNNFKVLREGSINSEDILGG